MTDTDIVITDVIAYIKNNVVCTLCQGKVKVMLTDDNEQPIWSYPRVCPICRGVGQISTRELPSNEEITRRMTFYFSKPYV